MLGECSGHRPPLAPAHDFVCGWRPGRGSQFETCAASIRPMTVNRLWTGARPARSVALPHYAASGL